MVTMLLWDEPTGSLNRIPKVKRCAHIENKSSKLGNFCTTNCGLNTKFENCKVKDNPSEHSSKEK